MREDINLQPAGAFEYGMTACHGRALVRLHAAACWSLNQRQQETDMAEPKKTPEEGGRTPAEEQAILQGHGVQNTGGHGITTETGTSSDTGEGSGLPAKDADGSVFTKGRIDDPGSEKRAEK